MGPNRALTDTYLDGAGLVAWEPAESDDGYRYIVLPRTARVHSLDDVLHRVASEIRELLGPDGQPP